SAAGAIGEITRKQLTASLTGAVSRTYDGTTAATLAASNYQIGGLIDGESITATQTSGTFASANAGNGITITASLASSDLSAGSNTLLSNYALPTSAAGAIGEITRKQLTASLTGAVSRTYDGTTAATLASSNYQIGGLVDGETITATQTSGTFASANAGSGISITASLASSDLSAGSNTLLSNYALPTSAAGAIGEITRKQLTASLTGAVSRTYDGTTAATLASSNYQIGGLVDGETITATQTSGTFASANAGSGISITASLASSDLSAGANTLLANYLLPTSAVGAIGEITRKQLTASLTGAVSRTYDGTTGATLASSNYQISGLVDGESITATQTSGTFASANAGSGNTITASFASNDLSAGSNTLLSNYALPTSAVGAIGEITRKQLTASLTGAVSRTYDGTTAATLASS
ncbi:YDG domain-containing protein, partial [Sphingomonas sp. YR710]|uniref:YDG domain-containing protein n=1 Tax=Sphingomonas sp. YR710 TaxID=1882773 RepID=UPI001C409D18